MADDERTDDELMQAYCAGQMAAFEQLYLRHERPLHRYLCRFLGQAQLRHADEVMQDTWMRVIDGRQAWVARADASFKTWLYTVAQHRAIDVLRRSGREWSQSDAQTQAGDDSPISDEGADWAAAWPAPESAQPEHQAFWRRAGAQLLQCLEALPSAQRAAFLLHHEEGLSLAQMSAALAIEAETLKSRLRYAMTKLRQCMGAHLSAVVAR